MSRGKLFGAGATVVAVLAVAIGSFWYFVLRDTSPDEVSLEAAIGSIATSTPTTANGSGATASPATSDATPAVEAQGLAGAWTVSSSGETFVGYRVNEELARVGFATAVGRTSGVTAEVMLTEDRLESATIEADMTKLASDSNMRDGQLRNQGIETNRFPTSTFVVTEAIDLPEGIESGDAVAITLKGDLTLHGVRKAVEIPGEAQYVDGSLVVIGSLPILFADYDIEKPNGASVLSIEDNGVMEFQLILVRDGSASGT